MTAAVAVCAATAFAYATVRAAWAWLSARWDQAVTWADPGEEE